MKKIMFNDTYSLTYAVLQKIKTNTRRTNQKLQCLSDLSDSGHTPQIRGNKVIAIKGNEYVEVCTLPYKVGEVVAIAQRYKDSLYYDKVECESVRVNSNWHSLEKLKAGWNNKMFVKAELMPHQIKITGIKIERLQDISDEDCLKEGVLKFTKFPYWDCEYQQITNEDFYLIVPMLEGEKFQSPSEAFASLIDGVSGKGTWEYNPYVLAYEFELIK